ncbi:MAG TPA: beta-galactosidase [Candidatus Acidoferrales bacterium]|nr:beta-galactosidase [Candidatus Acidoferrales bacterium]
MLVGAAVLIGSSASAFSPRHPGNFSVEPAKPHLGFEIIRHGTYPELRVDGQPFFIHAAAFLYARTPRDLWEPTLDRFRAMGINTINLYIPWNWHEPKQGQLDFDGHTNPRRDLRGLLALISRKGLKLIAMPGPDISNEWRHGGYPDWLLDQPGYNMSHLDWLEGRYPPLASLAATDADAAARGWLDNPAHMAATRDWFAAVAKELAPYAPGRTVRIAPDGPDFPAREASGPLLFVQLGNGLGSGLGTRSGADVWRYAGQLRAMLAAAGLGVPVFVNPANTRAPSAGSQLNPPIGVMDQWFLKPPPDSGAKAPALSARDQTDIEFEAESLETQPNFPPAVIEYQAGWYTPADDDRPSESSPENTLLSSRLLLGEGIRGLGYFPLQDAITPAGYSVPWANRSYRWDAAFGPDGESQPRQQAVQRNSQLILALGPELASSHKRADFGVVDPLGALPQDLLQPADVARISGLLMRVVRLANISVLSSEFLDPQHQSAEDLLRDPILLLPTFDPAAPQFQLSDHAQRGLVEYVRRGGTLIEFPERSAGKILATLWQSGGDAAERYGQGRVVCFPRDFVSWISLGDSIEQNRSASGAPAAMQALRGFLADAGVAPAVTLSDQSERADDLVVSELVSNEGTESLGERKTGQGFLSVTNFGNSPDDAVFQALSPSAGSRNLQARRISIHAIVPARDSLLLPLDIPICAVGAVATPCRDLVRSAAAELIGAQHNGKDVELSFYAPSRAEVHLTLASEASHVAIEDTKPETIWTKADHDLEIVVPRGPSPDFEQTIALRLPHAPRVRESEKVKRAKKQLLPGDLRYVVENSVRFPLSENSFLATYPPLIVPDADNKLTVLMRVENRNVYNSREVHLTLPHPLRGDGDVIALPRSSTSTQIDLPGTDQDRAALALSPDGLFHSTIGLRSSHDEQNLPLDFLLHRKGAVDHYRFDFDRDGMDEWVLESDRLRLIVSPESGGRAMALMDKVSGADLSTSVGLLRDSFALNDAAAARDATHPGALYGYFNRAYSSKWLSELSGKTVPALQLTYDAADALPSGATIQKTLRFDGPDTVSVQYAVALRPAQPGAPAAAQPVGEPESFIVTNSFPARADLGLRTRYCWPQPPAAGAPSAPAAAASTPKAPDTEDGLQCQDFTPGGPPIALPARAKSMQVRTPGDPVIAIEWDCSGQCPAMTIEPKNFSALFQLQFPPLEPGATAAYLIRIRAQNAPAP